MSEFNMQNGAFLGETSVGKENQVMPFFYRASKYQPVIPEVQGRDEPTSIPVDMVEIRQVGEKDTQREVVHDGHKRRWPTQWAAYEAGRAQTQAGTPIEHLWPAAPEAAIELKRFNIHTIEALADAPDSAGSVVPFLTERKKQAQAYLTKNAKAKGFDELETKLEAERQQRADLEKRLAEMEALMASATEPKKSRKLETAEN